MSSYATVAIAEWCPHHGWRDTKPRRRCKACQAWAKCAPQMVVTHVANGVQYLDWQNAGEA